MKGFELQVVDIEERKHDNRFALKDGYNVYLNDKLCATRTEAVEIIRSLVDQVIFRPTVEAGLEVELGDIAQMVRLSQNSNENSPISGAVHDEFARSVKVVAGARNHLNLLFNAPRLEAPLFGGAKSEPATHG